MSQHHLLLWAKTSRDPGDSGYHPLICHLIDTASVTRALWTGVLTPAVRRAIAEGCDIGEVEAGNLLPFLAALHDIGKATPVFQHRNDAALRRLTDRGYGRRRKVDDPGHGRTGAVLLESLLEYRFAWNGRASTQIALAIGGHHGRFPGDEEFRNANSRVFLGNPAWDDLRHDLIDDLVAHLADEPPALTAKPSHPASMIIAGFISVADWIASDENYFQYAVDSAGGPPAEFDLVGYADTSRDRARNALERLGWMNWVPDDTNLTFADLFPDLADSPRPVQQRVTQLPGIDTQTGIAILELPMGEGKTEAAFALADHWGAHLGQCGTYIAMPTMATANQMFDRACEFLQRRYPDQHLTVQLLHSHAALDLSGNNESDTPPPINPDQTWSDDPDDAPDDANARAGEWFTRRKRGLLAPFGVGTVDQALLSALQTRHVFVRLFGLAGKTVIFDEVHAYDAYMSRLFGRLLEWLGAIGTSVIILSATLPDARRQAFLTAWARGRDGHDPATVQSAEYPRISWLAGGDAMAESVDVSPYTARKLRLSWIPRDSKAIADLLRSSLADGGCAAVICNTVARAQEIYSTLKHYFPDVASDGHPELDLFHARFPHEERMKREQRALIRFGKPRGSVELPDGQTIPVNRPHRAILIATQVVEQSLDLDFDLMITDLAPGDLILQRSGRLHRHDRGNGRPEMLSGTPIIHIVAPDLEDDLPSFTRADEFIYDEHVLFRTWLALIGRESIQIPTDVGSLIEAIYDDREPDSSLPPPYRDRWASTAAEHAKARDSDEREAEYRWIRGPRDAAMINKLVEQPKEEDSSDVHAAHQALTRLGGPSVSIVCLYGSETGPAFDPEGTRSVSTTDTPVFDEARQLLQRAVSISDRRIVSNLLQREPPANWQRSALLRQQRRVVFGADGRAGVGKYTLRLDPELGLYVETKGDDDA